MKYDDDISVNQHPIPVVWANRNAVHEEQSTSQFTWMKERMSEWMKNYFELKNKYKEWECSVSLKSNILDSAL